MSWENNIPDPRSTKNTRKQQSKDFFISNMIFVWNFVSEDKAPMLKVYYNGKEISQY